MTIVQVIRIFAVAEPWIVGLNGEMGIWQLWLGRAIGSVVD
ncbi:MAG: hypothetical protein OXP69_10515 [Spirochaetaceae bacterium]|nr:hypothetical protein [Spirochaetaceae bacterium]